MEKRFEGIIRGRELHEEKFYGINADKSDVDAIKNNIDIIFDNRYEEFVGKLFDDLEKIYGKLPDNINLDAFYNYNTSGMYQVLVDVIQKGKYSKYIEK